MKVAYKVLVIVLKIERKTCVNIELMVSQIIKRLDHTARSWNSVKHMALGEAIYLVME